MSNEFETEINEVIHGSLERVRRKWTKNIEGIFYDGKLRVWIRVTDTEDEQD